MMSQPARRGKLLDSERMKTLSHCFLIGLTLVSTESAAISAAQVRSKASDASPVGAAPAPEGLAAIAPAVEEAIEVWEKIKEREGQ